MQVTAIRRVSDNLTVGENRFGNREGRGLFLGKKELGKRMRERFGVAYAEFNFDFGWHGEIVRKKG